MKFKVRLFATLKDRAGSEWITVAVEPMDETDTSSAVNVKSLLAAVGVAYPALTPALKTSLVAVNKSFAFGETMIKPGDEIALFPPVSGGAAEQESRGTGENLSISHSPLSTLHSPLSERPTCFMVTDGPLDVDEIHARLVQPDVGAIATFTGYVRGETAREGQPPETLFLEYEAYREMAELKMIQIADEIWERWPLVKGIAIIQRLGRLEIGEVTTFVACASAHRDQGIFDAARFGIDRLKEIVPVWKKEVGTDQSVWVEGHYRPTESD
jgi:molybdopterin synthase catalytic subunit